MNDLQEKAKAKRKTLVGPPSLAPEPALEPEVEWPEPPPDRIMGKILPFRRKSGRT